MSAPVYCGSIFNYIAFHSIAFVQIHPGANSGPRAHNFLPRWAAQLARIQEGRSAFKILTGTPKGNWPLGRPRRRWEDIIRMDLEEIGINAGNWVDSAQGMDYW